MPLKKLKKFLKYMYLKTQTAFGMVPGRITRLMNTIGYNVLNPRAAFLSKITTPLLRQLSHTDSLQFVQR